MDYQLQIDGTCAYIGDCDYSCGKATATTLDDIGISGEEDTNCTGPNAADCLFCRTGWAKSDHGSADPKCVPCPFNMKECTANASSCDSTGANCQFTVATNKYADYYYGDGVRGNTHFSLPSYINSI